jgi:hypothetical protein
MTIRTDVVVDDIDDGESTANGGDGGNGFVLPVLIVPAVSVVVRFMAFVVKIRDGKSV